MSGEGERELPKAIWEGPFTVFGVRLRCSVLDDEAHTRVINGEDLASLFKMMESADIPEFGDLEAFNRWQQGL